MHRSLRNILGVLIAVVPVALAGCGAPTTTGNVPTPTGVPATATVLITSTPAAAGPTDTAVAGVTPSEQDSGTPTPTVLTSPVTGSVLVEGGSSMAGGTSGDEIELQVTLEASSAAGEVTEMRVQAGTLFGCATEEAMSGAPWEPFASEKVFTTTAFINIQGWYASAQYRDEAGNVSPAYCDDISIEGMPPTP